MPQFRWLFLTVVLTLQLAACGSEGAAERKAQEEDAINAGTASPAMEPDSPAARAAAAEAAATAPSSALLTPPPPPVSRASQSLSGIADAVDGIECRPDISAEDCAQAKAAMAGDMHEMSGEQAEACNEKRTQIENAQQQLAAQSTDLNADLDKLAQEIATAQDWYKANCDD